MFAPVTAFWARTRRVFTGQSDDDLSTPEGRAQARLRRAGWAAVSSLAAKGGSIVSLFVSVPLTLHYLGPERYGLWMTLSSVLALLGFADLGMGIGLMNFIAHASGKEDDEAAANAVSSAFFMLAGVSIGLVIVALAVFPFVSWAKVFHVTSPSAVGEAGSTLLVLVGCFAVSMPLSLVQRVQIGYQEGGQSSLWQCAGSLLGLGALVTAIRMKAGLPWLTLAFLGAPALATLANNLVWFGLQRPALRPSPARVHGRTMSRLFRLGVGFLVLMVLWQVGYASDNLVIAHVLGNRAVAVYSVSARLFSSVIMVVSLITTPLWPAYGEAYARGDMAWIRRTFWNSIRFVLWISVAMALLLIVAGQPVIRHWADPRVAPSRLLLVGMGVWVVLEAIRMSASTFLNALNVQRAQGYILGAYALSAIPLKIVLGRRFGIEGVIWSDVATQLLVATVPYIVYVRRRHLA